MNATQSVLAQLNTYYLVFHEKASMDLFALFLHVIS